MCDKPNSLQCRKHNISKYKGCRVLSFGKGSILFSGAALKAFKDNLLVSRTMKDVKFKITPAKFSFIRIISLNVIFICKYNLIFIGYLIFSNIQFNNVLRKLRRAK